MTSFSAHGKVIHFSDHGSHATVGVAIDPDHEANASVLHPEDGDAVGSPFLTFKVGEEDRERPELREGSDVTLTFAAAKAAEGEGSTDPANKPKTSAAKSS